MFDFRYLEAKVTVTTALAGLKFWRGEDEQPLILEVCYIKTIAEP